MLSKITYMHVGGAERLPLLPWRLGQAQCIIIKYIHCGARDGTASNQMQSINSFLSHDGCVNADWLHLQPPWIHTILPLWTNK